MKLAEVFAQLAYGELSQVSLVDQATGRIAVSKYAPMVGHVNLGLSALYKRFHLKEGRLRFKLRHSQVRYLLSSDEDIVAEGDDDFNDDILKVEQVFTAEGKALGLNDSSNPYACATPSAAVLRVPLALANKSLNLPAELLTDALEVVYRANHPKLVYTSSSFNPNNIELELPDSHLEPLLLFIASRVHNPIGMSNEFHAGNSWYAKYEAACARLENEGLEVDQGSQNSRARRNGWV